MDDVLYEGGFAAMDKSLPRNYWIRIQDALGVYQQPDRAMRVQIELSARKMGLID